MTFTRWSQIRDDQIERMPFLRVPDVALGIGADRIIEVSESKTVKNRLHLDIHASGGQAVTIATRRERVDQYPIFIF